MAPSTSEHMIPRTIEASEFEAKCLNLVDEVVENGGAIVITRHGKPVAKLTAFSERPKSLFQDDTQRYPFIKEVADMLDEGVEADAVWEAELGLIDGV